MVTFKQYIENLWGEIPYGGRKPSDGQGGESPNPNRPDRGAGGATPAGGPTIPNAPLGMMKKYMKKMKKT